MRYRQIGKDELAAWSETLPREYFPLIRDGRARAGGVEFVGINAGSIVWMHDEKEGSARLLAIDVLPEARRMGIGTELIREAVKEMNEEKLSAVECAYGEYQDRVTLRPFLNACGLQTDLREMPLGRVSLKEAGEKLKEKGLLKESRGCGLRRLPMEERRKAREAIDAVSGGSGAAYDREKPECYVIFNDGKMVSAALFSEERKGVISLDYLYNEGSPAGLAGLLATALSELAQEYPEDTAIEMLLTTEQGQKLYEGLFGEARECYRLAVCSQEI